MYADPARPIAERLGWQTDLDGVVQVDAVPFAQASQNELDPATRAPLNEEAITLRRGLVRLRLHRDDAFASIELEANNVNGPTARLLGAAVGWHLPHATIVAGLIEPPFGTEIPTNLRDKPFLEVPTWANALEPGNYDGGVMVHGDYGLVRYGLALMNGAPSGDTQWKGRDPTSDYELDGRLGTQIDMPHLPGRPSLSAGVSFMTGTGLHAGIAPTKGQVVWEDANGDGIVQESELTGTPDNPGEPSQTFHRDALGADVMIRWCLRQAGAGFAFAEGVIGKNFDRGEVYADPIDRSRDIRELGYSIGIEQDVSKWALAGVRYDRYNADRDAAEQQGLAFVQTQQILSTWAFLAAARWTTGEVAVEYEHKRNPFGRNDAGQPVTREDDRLTIRAQVKF